MPLSMVTITKKTVVLYLFLVVSVTTKGVCTTTCHYYTEVENALVRGQHGERNLENMRAAFFPESTTAPLQVIVTYAINGTSQTWSWSNNLVYTLCGARYIAELGMGIPVISVLKMMGQSHLATPFLKVGSLALQLDNAPDRVDKEKCLTKLTSLVCGVWCVWCVWCVCGMCGVCGVCCGVCLLWCVCCVRVVVCVCCGVCVVCVCCGVCCGVCGVLRCVCCVVCCVCVVLCVLCVVCCVLWYVLCVWYVCTYFPLSPSLSHPLPLPPFPLSPLPLVTPVCSPQEQHQPSANWECSVRLPLRHAEGVGSLRLWEKNVFLHRTSILCHSLPLPPPTTVPRHP